MDAWGLGGRHPLLPPLPSARADRPAPGAAELSQDAAARPRVPRRCCVRSSPGSLLFPARQGPRRVWHRVVGGRKSLNGGRVSLCPSAGFRRSRRGRQLLRAMFYQPPSPSTATGVSGLSPHHSACVGKMFPVPEGKKGLELVSMATGRKRWVINPSPPSSGEGGCVGAGM